MSMECDMFNESPKFVMATPGPTFETSELFKRAIENNCRWFRLPLGYRDRDHLTHAKMLKEASEGVSIKLMADLPSERPRFGTIEAHSIEVGDQFVIKTEGSAVEGLTVNAFEGIIDRLLEGERVFILDGRIICRITEVLDGALRLKVEHGNGTLKSGNSLSFPDSKVHYKPVDAQDVKMLKAFEEQGTPVDWIALSMITDVEEIASAKEILSGALEHMPLIMSKIETAEALKNAEEIVKASDGVLVARGDLGQSIPYHQLPNAEKKILDIAKFYKRLSFVATHALEIFAETGVPQRAELIDLGASKWLGADGIILCKETVWSKYPIESIALADKVINQTTALNLSWVTACKETDSPLVAIEGPDGVGKTTLIERLRSKGYRTIRGVPPEWERADMKTRMLNPHHWIASAMYFLSGVLENVSFVGDSDQSIVFSDRSVWSSFAVHYKKNPERLPELCSLLALIAPYVEFPKKIIVLDGGFETANNRLEHDREIAFFAWLKELGLPISLVDASLTPEEIESAVLREVGELEVRRVRSTEGFN